MTIPINDKAYEVILSDTAGQEEFDKLRKFAYKHVSKTRNNCFFLSHIINLDKFFDAMATAVYTLDTISDAVVLYCLLVMNLWSDIGSHVAFFFLNSNK